MNNPPSLNEPDAPIDEVVLTAISRWKAKLIDISKRNRGLNFKPTPVTTVRIIDEYPPQVFRQLYLAEGKMRFRPGVTQKASTPETSAANGNAEFLDLSPSVDFAQYQNGELAQDQSDNFLQTNLPQEKLQHSLRRIAEQAQSSLEEQGVNTLFLALGTLHYKEADHSDDIFQAPLIFLPVQLNRVSAASPFNVTATDEDPFVNPALVEHLRNAHGMALPELPDRQGLSDVFDLQSYYSATEALSRDKTGWRVTSDIFLSFFSFQKYVMFKDLEANQRGFADHRLIKQIVRRTGSSLRELPTEVQSAELDEKFPSENTAQIVDADSSQLRAIYAAALGHDLVLVGPPGTGKSQTITNLIAQALSQNKSVLFVAEKRAALEVVYARLVEAGLGEFCLELHSNKANKRDVMRGIAQAWDVSLQDTASSNQGIERLPVVRDELTTYTKSVHSPFGALGISPYRAFSELELVRNAPRVELNFDVSTVNPQQLEETCRDLSDLAHETAAIGVPSAHPLRDTAQTLYLEADLHRLQLLLNELKELLSNVVDLSARVESDFGLPQILTLDDAGSAFVIADLLHRSPGAPLQVLASHAWNSPPSAAAGLINLGREIASHREQMQARFNATVLDAEHSLDASFIEAKENSPFGFLNFLSGRFGAIKSRWLSYRKPSYNATLLEQASHLRSVDRYRNELRNLTAKDDEGREYFGSHWQGENSDWNALENYVRWVVEFRNTCVQKGLKERAITTASNPHPDVTPLMELKEKAERARWNLEEITRIVRWPADYFQKTNISNIVDRVAELLDGLPLAQEWAHFEIARARVAGGPAAELLPGIVSGRIGPSDFVPAFRRTFFQSWIASAIRSRPPLATFSSLRHEQRVEEFRRLDLAVLHENRKKLVRNLRQRLRTRVREDEALRAPVSFLRTQLTLQRGHRPLRVTMERAFEAIKAIKPVFMMSPLSVAQFLKRDAITPFDLVIFDEASQLPSEDSVGAIARGDRLIVVGDPNQLPPTNFFTVLNNGGQVPRDENGDPVILDGASVLEEFGASGPPSTTLRWHYRSAHESLINFSNASFYRSELFTFPSVDTNSHAAGLAFEFVPDGLYEGAGVNQAEARRVADAVIDHARRTPDVSLGVGTFNLRQQLAITDELELRRRQDPDIEPFFDKNRREPFFVKNLENIQGDERDHIFLSVTYAKNAAGELKHFFGPLNSENGWKRLNVLTTRARKGMRVFSSIKGDYIDPSRVASSGPKFLRDFLIYAEHGRLDQAEVTNLARTESTFEEEIYRELTTRGLKLTPQVGAAGYRVDFGVMDDELPDRFICGIECDGVAYHLSETARDRDRLRQQVLEARGWTIIRIWSTDWFKDREGQINRVLKLVDDTRQKALEAARLEREEEERAAKVRDERLNHEEQQHLDNQAEEDAAPNTLAIAHSFTPGSTENIDTIEPRALSSENAAKEISVAKINKASEEVSTIGIQSASQVVPVNGDAMASAEALIQAGYEAPSLQVLVQTKAEPPPKLEAVPTTKPETVLASDYLLASTNQVYFGHKLTLADPKTLDLAIMDVAQIEAPVHIHDLAQRVAARWGHRQETSRMVPRIMPREVEAIKSRLHQLDYQKNLSFRNDFIYLPGPNSEIKVRSRLGTGIPAERISPEEHKEAVLLALRNGHSYDREELIRRVRGLFGYSRTGNQIKQQVGAAIDSLLLEDRIGEGSTGIRLRLHS